MDPISCPRCKTLDILKDRVHCPFCMENERRVASGKRILQTPTPQYPAGKLRLKG